MKSATRRTAALLLGVGLSAGSAQAALTWTLVYDQTSTTTRSLRGLSLSPDGNELYGGFIQGSSTAGFQHFDLAGDPPVGTAAGFYSVTDSQNGSSSTNHQAEAVTVDDRGVVFGASIKDSTSGDNARVISMNATLSDSVGNFNVNPLADITAGVAGETIGGLTFRKDGADRQLYVTRFRSDTAVLERYTIGGTGAGDASLALDASFNGTGQLDLQSFGATSTANSLRGIEVADDGTTFIASRENDVVYRISADLSSISTVVVPNAMDVAIFGGKAYVSTYDGTDSEIVEIDVATGALTGDSFTATGTFPRATSAGYAGIDINADGRIFLVDQFYGGSSSALMDRVLVSSVLPEPGTAALILLGSALGLRGRRRNFG